MTETGRSRADLRIRCADGRLFRIAGSGGDLLLHPATLRFLLPCAAIFALLERGSEPALSAMEGAMIALAVMGAGLIWGALVIRALRGRVRIVKIYTPLLTGGTLVLASATVWAMLGLLRGPIAPSGAELLRWTLRDMVVLVLMDLAFSQFAAPLHPRLRRIRPGARPGGSATASPPSPPAAEADAAEQLVIGAEHLPLATLHAIRAEDHYLHVLTTDRRMMLRGRLSDAVAMIDPRRGIQINRSTWVAFAAIRDVTETERGILTLRLPDGTVERVAQSRRIAFQAAMAQKARGGTP